MTPGLQDLMTEISAGVEIYFTGRSNGLYSNSAFILCDDYTELVSKLFLKSKDNHWSDDLSNGRFKDYKTVLSEVVTWHAANDRNKQNSVDVLVTAMKERRVRRNNFFHSTHLLDLTVRANVCINAFCDLMSYGLLLFGREWEQTMQSAGNLDTLHLLLRLEKAAATDSLIKHKMDAVLNQCVHSIPKPKAAMPYSAILGTDLLLRMTVLYGSGNLRLQLKALLPL